MNQIISNDPATGGPDSAALIGELQNANAEFREARRAALNLMEDAIASRETLRINEKRMRRQKEAFQAAMNGAPIDECLNRIASLVTEETLARTAFYITDEGSDRLKPIPGAGNMSENFLEQTNGFNFHDSLPTRGLAIPTRDAVITPDVFREPGWEKWLSLARQFSFRSCWTFPIKTRDNQPIGTFAMYFSEAREPSTSVITLADIVTQTAGVIIAGYRAAAERTRAEEALRESEERYRVALSSANMAAWDWNIDLNQINWNDQHYYLLGLEPDGKPKSVDDLFSFVDPRDKEWLAAALTQSKETGRVFQADFRIVRADNHRICWMSGYGNVVAKRSNRSTRMMGVMFDISQRKQLEQHKEDFIGIASHELKTPVTSIKVYTETLRELVEDTQIPQVSDLVAKLDMQVDRFTTLIRVLLDTTKMSQGDLKLSRTEFNLPELVSERIEDIQMTTQRHDISLQTCPDLVVCADRERISEVISNLLSNAIKYSPAGGNIAVNVVEKMDGVQVSVDDHGMGIPDDVVAHVFDRFYRVRDHRLDTFPGMGLGLYISASIINKHGGEIWVKSREGKGSTFFFWLPAAEPGNMCLKAL